MNIIYIKFINSVKMASRETQHITSKEASLELTKAGFFKVLILDGRFQGETTLVPASNVCYCKVGEDNIK